MAKAQAARVRSSPGARRPPPGCPSPGREATTARALELLSRVQHAQASPTRSFAPTGIFF